ncbi:Serine/threonine-protein kinase EDR1 [Ananas comosus]|uniref:non-specific serine/threonine protein kinase n=1 Tax=Ananas comosus TaxID=4615 RepID=A0A199V1K7_ANACO|nr:Serine/threonine-protein kinase EDR1 [Ananas comosus]
MRAYAELGPDLKRSQLNLLKKLHIGPSQSHGDDGPSSPSTKGGGGGGGGGNQEPKPLSGLSNWLNSVTGKHGPSGQGSPPPPTPPQLLSSSSSPSSSHRGERREAGPSASSPASASATTSAAADAAAIEAKRTGAAAAETDMEEEYQIQLALEMSAREDPEAVQIEVVKQISLGSCPPESTPAEVLAYRYWNYNSLNFDDKILDGFYYLYGIMVEPNSAKMPSLIDLQGAPFSDNVSWEAVLVNRTEDGDLLKLEKKALIMAREARSQSSDFVEGALVQRLANLVANYMGGIVYDPESMLMSYQKLSSYLRESVGNLVLPLGRLTIGLARHRALLFKVLADSVGIPCRLVKGKQYTGSDDGALNIVKVKDGREYIVDLMAYPGTLIPSDGAGLVKDYEENIFVVSPFSKGADSVHMGSSVSGVSSSAGCSLDSEPLDKRSLSSYPEASDTSGIHTLEFSNKESEKLSSLKNFSTNLHMKEKAHPIGKSRDTNISKTVKAQEKSGITVAKSPSRIAGINSSSAVNKMKVQDVSQYMIDAAKENPQLAQKLQDVLLESGVIAPPNLFSELYTGYSEDLMTEDKSQSGYKGEKEDEITNRIRPLKPVEDSTEGAGYDVWDNRHIENDHDGPEQEKGTGETHQQEAERNSGKSTGTDSTKSDIALDDVAELEIQWEDLTLGERIGLGSFGEVYKGELHGTEVAVKKFLHQDISGDALEEFRSEARGMNYLHNCTPIIVHRDLKSPNLLVDKNWVVKVCDFGLSRMKHSTFLSSRSTAGTAEWMAPEVLRNEPSDEKCDVFSFGVILWELCTLQQPWEGMNPMQVVGAVGFQHRRLDIPDDMDPVIADIIKKCWQTDPKKRPSFSEIMAALKPLLKAAASTQVLRRRLLPAGSQEKGNS